MSMTVTWTLGELLAKARKDRGMDQLQLAEEVGIARNTLSTYERGRSVPPFDVMVRIARVTGVELAWLATGVNAETAPAVAGAVSDARPEGLEPPTFCSVAEAIEIATEWLGAGFDAEYQALLSVEAVEL